MSPFFHPSLEQWIWSEGAESIGEMRRPTCGSPACSKTSMRDLRTRPFTLVITHCPPCSPSLSVSQPFRKFFLKGAKLKGITRRLLLPEREKKEYCDLMGTSPKAANCGHAGGSSRAFLSGRGPLSLPKQAYMWGQRDAASRILAQVAYDT